MADGGPQANRPAKPMETIDLRTISEADARAVATLLYTVWPKPGRTVESLTADLMTRWRDYRGPEAQFPRSFVVRESGKLIAHASATPRTIGTAVGDLTIMALARVCTHPDARGRKLGDLVARAAFEPVDDGAYQFSLFQTRENVKPFYDRLGAVQIDNTFTNSQAVDPALSRFADPVIMRYPATAGWPAGQIDLNGPAW
jgi:predicted N-acetyltransferase YhbS